MVASLAQKHPSFAKAMGVWREVSSDEELQYEERGVREFRKFYLHDLHVQELSAKQNMYVHCVDQFVAKSGFLVWDHS